MSQKKTNQIQKRSINFWQMIRDVLIASLNKGQFPLGIFGIAIIIMLLKMPPEHISKTRFHTSFGFK